MNQDIEVHASFKSPYTKKEYRPGFYKDVDYDTARYAKVQSFGKIHGPSITLTPKVPKETEAPRKPEMKPSVPINVIDLPQISDGAKRLIKKHKITDEQLLGIKPTGKTGDLLTKDIRKYLKG